MKNELPLYLFWALLAIVVSSFSLSCGNNDFKIFDASHTAPVLSVAGQTQTTVTLSWTSASIKEYPNDIFAYTVAMATRSGLEDFNNPSTNCVNVNITSCTINMLTSGGKYFFKVQANDTSYNSYTLVSNEVNSITGFWVDTGNNISLWTINGNCGQSTSFGNPAPSYFCSGQNGNYMFTQIPNITPPFKIEFDVYSDVRGDFYFLTDANGNGQMARIDTSLYSSDLATTTSMYLWTTLNGVTLTSDTWNHFEIIVKSTTQADLYINGTLIDSNFPININGYYIGLVGATGDRTTWWDNINIHY
jgi:hypothetical protein